MDEMGGWARWRRTRRASQAMTPPKREYARAAGCDGDFANRDFAPNVSPTRGSTSVFFVRFSDRQRDAGVRNHRACEIVAAAGEGKASPFAFRRRRDIAQ